MNKQNIDHTFHIPVMGTAFTIDTPIKVARYGISSVISIGDDELCETMRDYYSKKHNEPFEPIGKWDEDSRARRITAYLNLINKLVNQQIAEMKQAAFEEGSDLMKYFELLPETSSTKALFYTMINTKEGKKKEDLQKLLREKVAPGSIDVNIMTKCDQVNFDKDGKLMPDEFSDACSGLRGYATSDLESGIVFSAGFNRRLYAYIDNFNDFFPDETGYIKKKIIMKVSDYRSSLTQGRFLAKKGVWISEHRIESGLNCGGHAFASEGYLLGPILEEFKQKKTELISNLLVTINEALEKKGRPMFNEVPETDITVQGGIGTAKENNFLLSYYGVKRTGWATPFLLVAEATTLDDETRQLLIKAKEEDLYLSEVSPLGIPFNTVRDTASEKQKLERIESGRPGSPCPKGFLKFDTEFTKKPICKASIAYQRKKIKQLESLNLAANYLKEKISEVVNKSCLCEDLAAGALIKNFLENKRPLKTTVCPGPNLAYFSKLASLSEMASHIYGRINLLNETKRPNMFIKELKMYVDYLGKEVKKAMPDPTTQTLRYLENFQKNVFEGIDHYKEMIPKLVEESKKYQETMRKELLEIREELQALIEKNQQLFPSLALNVW